MNRYASTSEVTSGERTKPGLRAQLLALGYTPGPITDQTRATYRRKLRELQEQERGGRYRDGESDYDSQSDDYSQSDDDTYCDEETAAISICIPFGASALTQDVETERYLQDANWTRDLRPYKRLETKVINDFRGKKNMGTRDFYTYLLLDPRVMKGLFSKAGNKHTDWTTFVKSVFYIGRGTGNRRVQHLRDALKISDGRDQTSPITDKIQCIMDIWTNNKGVIPFIAFDHLVEMEACTYEAVMIDALGVSRLTNEIEGTHYFRSDWYLEDCRKLGFYLLYKAMKEFLKHGEEQIFPEDLNRRRSLDSN